jgi:hypothetical protein
MVLGLMFCLLCRSISDDEAYEVRLVAVYILVEENKI